MHKLKLLHRLAGFALLLAFMADIIAGQPICAFSENSCQPPPAFSSLETSPAAESLKLVSPYPVLKDKAGSLFEFQVELQYHGSQARVFDLSVLGNQGSYVDILAEFTSTDKGIQSILVKPDQEFPPIVKVRFNPILSKRIDPGEYLITLRASSGNLADSIDLTAVVTSRFELLLATSTGRLNAEITAGKDNHIAVMVRNNSSVDLKDVRLNANVPGNWGIKFVPDKISVIGVDDAQLTDMIISPNRDTIAGDYEIKVMALHPDAFRDMSLRITVATPTIWGWISVLIIILVIAGLAAIFVRLGRR
jgi:uncharacterized membrane protein